MARKPGQRFASDHRRYFRVMEDILHNTKLLTVGNDGLAAFIRLLAMLNQRKCRDGTISLDPLQLQTMCGKGRRDAAQRLARRLDDADLISFTQDGYIATILVRNWSKMQELPPLQSPPDPVNSPAPTPTPTPTPNPRDKESLDRETERVKAKSAPRDTSTDRARNLWPELMRRVATHGVTWCEEPTFPQVGVIAKRISEGASDADIIRAIEGYIRKHGTTANEEFDPLGHLTASTLYKADKFPVYLEASRLPDRKRNSSAERFCECTTYKKDAEVRAAKCFGCGNPLRSRHLRELGTLSDPCDDVIRRNGKLASIRGRPR